MLRQAALPFATPVGLTCAFGEPWIGPHPLCQAEADRLCAEFDADVAAGIYDPQGYTPADRRAQAKRQARSREG